MMHYVRRLIERWRRAGFWLVSILLVLAGVGLRLAPRSAAQPQAWSSSALETLSWSQASEAAETALAFYRLMGKQTFEPACAQAIEFVWEWSAEGNIRALGIKPYQQCVADSQADIKTSVGGFVLYEIEAEVIMPPADAPLPVELAAFLALPGAPAASELAWVRAWGTARLMCTVFDWDRDLVMVHSDGTWKLLMPPPSQYARLRMLGWFYKPDPDMTYDTESGP